MAQPKKWIRWIITSCWIAVGAGVTVLLVAAIHKGDAEKCRGLNITIKGVSNNFFVDRNDIIAALNQYIDGNAVGQPVTLFNLKSLETDLQKNIWVKQTQLFFDNNSVLQIIITEREPVARVFATTGATFYIDSSLAMLPLSDKFSARLPVFTGFPSDKAVLTRNDSALLKEVCQLSMAIQKDSFMMALVDQVDITPQRNFEMVPKIGNSTIVFGNAANIESKFNKLKLFYQEVLTQCGLNYYSQVNVEYAGQVVAKRKGAEDKSADSLRTLQIMQAIAQSAEHLASDSLQMIAADNDNNTTSVSLIQQSIQRDDNQEAASETSGPAQGIPVLIPTVSSNPLPMKNPGVAKPVAAAPKPAVVPTVTPKPTVVKPAGPKPKPVLVKPPTAKAAPPKPKPAQPKPAPPKKHTTDNDY